MQTIATLIQLTKWTVARQGHAGHARGRGRGRVWVGVDAASGSVPGPCDTTKKLWSPSTESSHESKSETMHGERVEKEREAEEGGQGVGPGWLSGVAAKQGSTQSGGKIWSGVK